MNNLSTKKTNTIVTKRTNTITTSITGTASINCHSKKLRASYILNTVSLVIIIYYYYAKQKGIIKYGK